MKPTHNYSKWKQFLAILPLMVSELCVGMGYGWSAPSLKYLVSPESGFGLTNEEKSWVIALAELGKLTSPLIGSCVDKVGRKGLLVLCTAAYVVAWGIIAVAARVELLYLARYIFGLALGLYDLACCIYIGEVADPKIRGTFLSSLSMLFFAGILCGFVLGNYLPYRALCYSMFLSAIISLIFCPLLVETPQYLIVKNKHDRAKKILTRLRGGGGGRGSSRKKGEKDRNGRVDEEEDQVEMELIDMKDHIKEERSKRPHFRQAITDRTNLKIFFLIMALCTAGPMSGYNAIVYYASEIFREKGLITAGQFTILYGTVQLLAAALTTLVIDVSGRRFLLLTFGVLATLIQLTTASLFYAQDILSNSIDNFQWIIFVTVTSYSALYTFGFLPALFTLRSELFPHDLKGFGGSMAVICHAGSSFLCSKMFPGINERYGIYVNFLIYSMASMATLILTYFWIPETKGKTLVEIQKQFRNES